jgi:hypothetical protein
MKYLLPIALLAILSSPVLAQQDRPCGSATEINNVLINRFGEQPLADFTDKNGALLLLYVSPTNNTWTVLSLEDAETACVIDAGSDFEPTRNRLGGKKS